jgi:hypothetical protein
VCKWVSILNISISPFLLDGKVKYGIITKELIQEHLYYEAIVNRSLL